jgi:hypothetical protein
MTVRHRPVYFGHHWPCMLARPKSRIRPSLPNGVFVFSKNIFCIFSCRSTNRLHLRTFLGRTNPRILRPLRICRCTHHRTRSAHISLGSQCSAHMRNVGLFIHSCICTCLSPANAELESNYLCICTRMHDARAAAAMDLTAICHCVPWPHVQYAYINIFPHRNVNQVSRCSNILPKYIRAVGFSNANLLPCIQY